MVDELGSYLTMKRTCWGREVMEHLYISKCIVKLYSYCGINQRMAGVWKKSCC